MDWKSGNREMSAEAIEHPCRVISPPIPASRTTIVPGQDGSRQRGFHQLAGGTNPESAAVICPLRTPTSTAELRSRADRSPL